jgi:hypothetical protein
VERNDVEPRALSLEHRMALVMKIFISWSGPETSVIGTSLKTFLETTFAGHVQAFLSDRDIAPGERFEGVIAASLESSSLGILLVTPENQVSPWLLFEAGSLASKNASGSVIPILLGLKREDLLPPLSQFQNVVGASEDGFLRICERIRGSVEMPEEAFELLFRSYWPALKKAIDESSIPSAGVPRPRSLDDMVAEILLTVTSLSKNTRSINARNANRPYEPSMEEKATRDFVYRIVKAVGAPGDALTGWTATSKLDQLPPHVDLKITDFHFGPDQLDDAARQSFLEQRSLHVTTPNSRYFIDSELGNWSEESPIDV